MTDDRTFEDEDSSLASEYVLGILDGDEWRRARRLAATDPGFREEVTRWRGRLGSMLDTVEPITAPAGLWSRIASAIGPEGRPSSVYVLHRKVAIWQGVAASMTALAACLALFVMFRPATPAPVTTAPQVASSPMVARVSEGQRVALVANWDPQRGQLLIATAAGLRVQPTRSNELWMIPSGGKPRSLGVMPDGTHALVAVPSAARSLMRAGTTLAVSVEPRGGSPTGAPTGPVVASGVLEAA